ncbi:hypothetical protein, partial [Salmonella sp. gx-f5]|uniref:hypothetical protein n=1 Tax=Salmonella sp. gx-f5 TaxID=2582605 RepID=UPI001F25937D
FLFVCLFCFVLFAYLFLIACHCYKIQNMFTLVEWEKSETLKLQNNNRIVHLEAVLYGRYIYSTQISE